MLNPAKTDHPMKKMSLHAWLLLSAVSLTPAAARTACEADIPEPVKTYDMETLELTQEWDKTFPQSDKVEHSKITFHNRYGITLAADLYKPLGAEGRLAAIAVCGPYGAVKEQVSGLYAQSLAERGFLAIAFDPSFYGESGGTPRNLTSPEISTDDFSAAVDCLLTRDDVDSLRVGICGICGWGGFALNAAAIDPRIRATVTSTMYDMSRVSANGYFDAMTPDDRQALRVRLNEQRTLFKLFMADTGLLCAAGIDNIQFSILNGDLSINMGSLLENAFAQIFAANGFKLWYFNKQKYGELDFVLQLGPKCLPVEIKSGKDYRRHAALNNILGVSEWKFDEAIVFCMDNVSTDGKVTYLPWYMSMFLKTPQPESYIVDADFSGLSACIPKS